jgi:large subunit ribosomal protein L24
MQIRKDDMVEVITGADKDAKPRRVLRTLPTKGKVVVEGVNRVYKHMKPSRRNLQGGRLSKEMPIDVSNVMLYCGTCKKGTRIMRKYRDDGTKVRACRKCQNEFPGKPLSKPRKAYAKK